MRHTSRIMTVASVVVALIGFGWYAIAAGATAGLPPSNAIAGWAEIPNSTRSGAMGSKASYDAYDGGVEAMQDQGIAYFAQRMYRQAATKRYLTVDVYQLSNAAKAKSLYDRKRTGYRAARPLGTVTGVKDRAVIGTLGSLSFGVGQRGKYVWEISMSKAATAAERRTVQQFVNYASRKLGG